MMAFEKISIGKTYEVKTAIGYRRATVTKKLHPRNGMLSDYYVIKYKYEHPNVFGCIGGIIPSKNGIFDFKETT